MDHLMKPNRDIAAAWVTNVLLRDALPCNTRSYLRYGVCNERYNRIVKHVGRIAFGAGSRRPTLVRTVGLHTPITAGIIQCQASPPC